MFRFDNLPRSADVVKSAAWVTKLCSETFKGKGAKSSQEKSYFVSGSKAGTVQVWHLRAFPKSKGAVAKDLESSLVAPIALLQHPAAVMDCVVYSAGDSADCVFIATVCAEDLGSSKCLIRVWSIDGTLVKTVAAYNCRISCVTARSMITNHSEDALIFAGCEDGSIRVWGHGNERLLSVLEGHRGNIAALVAAYDAYATVNTTAVSATSLQLIAGCADGTLHCRDLAPVSRTITITHRSDIRVHAMCAHSMDSGSNGAIIVTGASDGKLRCWSVRTSKDEVTTIEDIFHVNHSSSGWRHVPYTAPAAEHAGNNTLLWTATADLDGIRAVAIYHPLFPVTVASSTSASLGGVQSSAKSRHSYSTVNSVNSSSSATSGGFPHLHRCLVISGGDSGAVHIVDLASGEAVCAPIIAHDCARITALHIFAGYANDNAAIGPNGSFTSTAGSSKTSPTPMERCAGQPFFASGSADCTVRVWSLATFQCMRTFSGHTLDVTSIAVHCIPDAGADNVMIVSGSTDCTIRLWSLGTGQLIKRINHNNAAVMAMATLDAVDNDADEGLVLVSGDARGDLTVFSLRPPYLPLRVLRGAHREEIRSLSIHSDHHCRGSNSNSSKGPVLVSGSWDGTTTLWDMSRWAKLKTFDDHSSAVIAVQAFSAADITVATAGVDGVVHTHFHAHKVFPSSEEVRALFAQDLYDSSSEDSTSNGNSKWPRIASAAAAVGVEVFFQLHYPLFFHALMLQRLDFLSEFLPRTRCGLVCCHTSTSKRQSGSDTSSAHQHSSPSLLASSDDNLLLVAMELGNRSAVRIIVQCWCRFLSTPVVNTEFDEVYGIDTALMLSTMEKLSKHYPAELVELISGIRLCPVQRNAVPSGATILFEDGNSNLAIGSSDASVIAAGDCWYFLPLLQCAGKRQLELLLSVCHRLDNRDVFASEAATTVVQFVWKAKAQHSHVHLTVAYSMLVLSSSAALVVYGDPNLQQQPNIYHAWFSLQAFFNFMFLLREVVQCAHDPLMYVGDFWNWTDIIVTLSNLFGNTLRIVKGKETNGTRILLSLAAIFMWANLLQYMRAFKSTGPLVAMIFKILKDMRNLMLIFMFIIIGFTLAFWVCDSSSKTASFTQFGYRLTTSFSYATGNYDFSSIHGHMKDFMIGISTAYVFICTLLLLNLLIALMGNSYSEVQGKLISQWRYEQASACLDYFSTPLRYYTLWRHSVAVKRMQRAANSPPPQVAQIPGMPAVQKLQLNVSAVDEMEAVLYVRKGPVDVLCDDEASAAAAGGSVWRTSDDVNSANVVTMTENLLRLNEEQKQMKKMLVNALDAFTRK